jgi:hypothetical protein
MGISGQSYTDMVLDMVEEFSQLKGRYPILSQLTKPNIKTGENVLTLNDRAMLKDPQLAEIYYENLLDLANENVKKVSDPEDNKRISKLFALLPIMSMYQHGIGYSKYGFNEALPYDDFLGVMQSASQIFMEKQLNENTLGNIFDTMVQSFNRDFTNFVRDPKTYIAPQPVVEPVEEEIIMEANTPMIEDMLAMAQTAEEETTEEPIQPSAIKLVTIDSLSKNPIFENMIVEFVSEIATNKTTPVAMRNVNKGERILMVAELMKEKFDQKAWISPAQQNDGSYVTPLAEDSFKSFDEFLTFALLHEAAHNYILKEDGETIGEYEDRVNQEALRRLSEINKPITGRITDINAPEGLPGINRTSPNCE